jgi:hypothetical protein
VSEPSPVRVEVVCPSCSAAGRVPAGFAGKTVTCKRCGEVVKVPGGFDLVNGESPARSQSPDRKKPPKWAWASAALFLGLVGGVAIVFAYRPGVDRAASAAVAVAAPTEKHPGDLPAVVSPKPSTSPPTTPSPVTAPRRKVAEPVTWGRVEDAASKMADRAAAEEPGITARRLGAAPETLDKVQFDRMRSFGQGDDELAFGLQDGLGARARRLGLTEFVAVRLVRFGRSGETFQAPVQARFEWRRKHRPVILADEAADVYEGWYQAGQLTSVMRIEAAKLLTAHYAGEKPFVIEPLGAFVRAFTAKDFGR